MTTALNLLRTANPRIFDRLNEKTMASAVATPIINATYSNGQQTCYGTDITRAEAEAILQQDAAATFTKHFALKVDYTNDSRNPTKVGDLVIAPTRNFKSATTRTAYRGVVVGHNAKGTPQVVWEHLNDAPQNWTAYCPR